MLNTMMFWVAFSIAFFGGVLMLPLARERIRARARRRNPNAPAEEVDRRTDRLIDTARFAAVVIGLVVGGIMYIDATTDKQRLQGEVASEKNARQELRRQLDEVEERAKPRRLIEPVRKQLTGALKQLGCPPHVKIHHDSTDHEARTFAADFKSVFLTAGCSANLHNMIGGLRPDLTGMHIAVAPARTTAPPGAVQLMAVLNQAGLPFGTGGLSGLQGDDFAFVIGSKL